MGTLPRNAVPGPATGTSKTFEKQWENSNSLVPVNPGPRGPPTGPVGSAAETLGTLAKPLEKQWVRAGFASPPGAGRRPRGRGPWTGLKNNNSLVRPMGRAGGGLR